MYRDYCGIDFGTSNSTVGIVRGDEPVLVPLEGSAVTIPSALFFGLDDGSSLCGRSAIREYVDGVEGRLLRALKSILGSQLIHESTWVSGKSITYKEIIGQFLNHLKTKTESKTGRQISSVVLGRPIHFVDDSPSQDVEAQNQLQDLAFGLGFKEVQFQYEPIAAALDYEQRVTSEEVALIVDMGGGTSDFSIVRVSPERASKFDRKEDILAYSGIHIGGTDFDRLFSLAHVMPLLGFRSKNKITGGELPSTHYHNLATWHLINKVSDKQSIAKLAQLRSIAVHPEQIDRLIWVLQRRKGHEIASKVEDMKIQLTSALNTSFSMHLASEEIYETFSRTQFDDSIRDSVSRCIKCLKETYEAAGLKPEQISSLFLTGGSSIIPLIRSEIGALFGSAKIVEGDMFASVGLGLALDAKRRFR